MFIEIAIRDNEDILVLLLRFRIRSKDIPCDHFEGFGCGKVLKLASMVVCRTFMCAALTYADYAFNTCNYVRPVKFASQRIVHVTVAGMYRNWEVVR